MGAAIKIAPRLGIFKEGATMARECTICGNSTDNKIHTVREMMFGCRDEFEYIECSDCGCLQIADIPANLNKYYPEGYYSYSECSFSSNPIKHFLKKQRLKYCTTGKGVIGKIVTHIYGIPNIANLVKAAKIKFDSHILDVGCGAGRLLLNFREYGYRHLTGADPFISRDIFYKNGVRIYKKGLLELESDNKFDCIMLHHSFEHMHDPLSVFSSISARLKNDGVVVLRIPIVSSFAWQHYKTNWVQLDAPRHFFLHSLKSIELLANQAGFGIENVEFDSDEFQFWGSEQYAVDISLNDDRSFSRNPKRSMFTHEDIEKFRKRSAELNTLKMGDQAIFYIRKISPA